MDKFKHVDTWVFDLDNTLYPADTTTYAQILDRMILFVADTLKMPAEEAAILRVNLYEKHGTTLRGLILEHQVDPHAFIDFTHSVDLSDVPVCAVTQEYLARLPGKKIIFTNAPLDYAGRMLKHLGITHHFDHVFATEDAGFVPKPHPDPYHDLLKKFPFDPARACMLEDTEANLKPAADLGMTTVWLHGKNPALNHPHVHHKAPKLTDWLQNTIKRK